MRGLQVGEVKCRAAYQAFKHYTTEKSLSVTFENYEIFHHQYPEHPSARTIVRTLGNGSWNSAREFLEGPDAILPSQFRDHWLRTGCLDSLRAYVQSVPLLQLPSGRGYMRWREAQAEQGRIFPTSMTIIHTLGEGSWKKALHVLKQFEQQKEWGNVRRHAGGPAKIWTHEKCEAALDAYKVYCEQHKFKVTQEGYEEWRKTNDAPACRTIERVFGSWTMAIKKDALKLNTLEECKSALRTFEEYSKTIGGKGSAPEYNVWRNIQKPLPPSLDTIQRLFGSWNEARMSIATDFSQFRFNPGGRPRLTKF